MSTSLRERTGRGLQSAGRLGSEGTVSFPSAALKCRCFCGINPALLAPPSPRAKHIAHPTGKGRGEGEWTPKSELAFARALSGVLLFLATILQAAEPQEILLWPKGAPGSEGQTGD